MKEVKFRAWDSEHEQMIEWEDMLSWQIDELNNPLGDEGYIYFLQYIGLKDKDKKEVYVDSIYSDSDGRLWQILDMGFCESIWCYRLKSLSTGKEYPMDRSIEKFSYKGNIHENPGLLKK